MIWQNLATPEVRDLAWACFSPSLIITEQLADHDSATASCRLPLTDQRRNFLRELDHTPAPLQEHLANSHSARLGIYFEMLWHFMLDRDPCVELVAHNLAVREGARTLGEFDVIYFCRERGQYIHLELAVKFYLEVEGQPRWLGPGCRDSLEQKLDHLLSHQIRLSQFPAGRARLKELGVEAVSTEIELKGCLFAHSDNPPLPQAYNRENTLCNWYSLEDFSATRRNAHSAETWVALPRKRWLAPCDYSLPGYRELPEATDAYLRGHFSTRRQPLLLAACDTEGRELRRCFVTPGDWPRR